eukprot:TRINITY_DN3091_c0_g1_i1.p1 TRINITY_DN3091_c0_g1~~TRINITY_DN3091_c0_g1_i1.p1  ORF type:complete len:199 (-),score=19.18 TRINITY_DN3091_c0_g1_i1:24-620(-)
MGVEAPCAICGKISKTLCGRCKKQYYCSRECQSEAWKTHKALCKPQEGKRLASPQFPTGTKFIGRGEEDGITLWLHSTGSKAEGTSTLLEFKVWIQNSNKGTAKITSVSPLLTLNDRATREKAHSASLPRFIEVNGTAAADATKQVILNEKEHAVLQVSFLVDASNEKAALDKCHLIEVPVKIETVGVVKVAAVFGKQ